MNPIVTFEMQNGKTFKAELYPDKAPNTVNNFIYQCGDIRFDLSLEYRAKLFWVIENLFRRGHNDEL